MEKTSTWLLEFKSNIYTQTGEDGIIEKILDILPESDKWCVEFGAWDGQYFSNTRNLIENRGYSAILIEGSKPRFNDLQKNYSLNEKVITINQFVGFDEADNLDHILKNTPIPSNFDFLSIDIDGNDYHVWKAMSEYEPKVVCIEFNPTIPTEVSFVQPAERHVNQGASLLSLVEIGKHKGYELISVLSVNAFFVRSEHYPLFEIQDNRAEVLRRDLGAITHIFSGYDGKIFLRGNLKLPWHDIKLKESKIQHLPRFLRKYPENYWKIERALFLLHLMLSDPRLFASKVRKIIHRLVST